MSESAYVSSFVANMIEIEQINVGLSAVRAGVITEISAYPGT